MILIALGANLPFRSGGPKETLSAALKALSKRGVEIERQSDFYESPAWPNPSDPSFVNAVVSVRTHLDPPALLGLLHSVEEEFGRRRSVANAPRTLDLDLIDYNGMNQGETPILPHPRMEGRRFVLVPLRDVAPKWHHPVSGLSVDELIERAPAAPISRL